MKNQGALVTRRVQEHSITKVCGNWLTLYKNPNGNILEEGEWWDADKKYQRRKANLYGMRK